MSVVARLCKEIILEEFGPFVSKVSRQLLLKGRLTLNDIARFTELPVKTVRESLIILIQHGITYFSEAPEGKSDPTYYTIDAEKILLRLRIGSILKEVEDRYGKEAHTLCKALFVNGRMTLPGIRKWLQTVDKKNSKSEKYEQAFIQLVTEQYIKAVMPEHSRSTMDRYLAATEKESEKYTIMTSKELANVKMAAQAQINAEYDNIEIIGIKRKALDSLDYQRKRNNCDDDYEVDDKVFFSVNYDQFNILFRNKSIVDYATERINRTAGIVISAFFEHGKDKMKTVKEEDSPSATPVHIANLLTNNDMMTRGDIVLPKDPMEPNKKPSLQDVVRGYTMLLKTDTAGFIKAKDERGAHQYAVDFHKLRNSMKRKLLEGLITERYGIATCRILRILIEKGKLDESQVQKFAMLPPKDTREKLSLLNTEGYVEIQEIPRSADRAPGRCFYLWYVPLDKCYQELLMNAYKIICNLQQRKVQELNSRKWLIDKLNRKDVIENPELLSEHEQSEVDKMNKVIERIEVSKSRIDKVVMILRDF